MITLNLTPDQARDLRIAIVATIAQARRINGDDFARNLADLDDLIVAARDLHAAATAAPEVSLPASTADIAAALKPVPNWEPPTGHADYPYPAPFDPDGGCAHDDFDAKPARRFAGY